MSLARDLQVLTSHRVSDERRLSMLTAVVGRLAQQLAAPDMPLVRVVDATPPALADEVESTWAAAVRGLEYARSGASLVQAYDALLCTATTRWFALQFDDQLSVGMSPELLRAAVKLLQRHAGSLGIVCPLWPVATEVDDHARQITLISHEVRSRGGRDEYRFFTGGWLRPVIEEEVDGHRFGVFENFTYGFFFNHLIAPVDDYIRRLRWYAEHVRPATAHGIELAAASRLRGPYWTHLGVCLDGFSILDVDFAHTDIAVRNEAPSNEGLLRAVEAGYALVARPRRV